MQSRTPQQRRNTVNTKDQVVYLKVFGNYFCPETRTICALLDLNEVSYQLDSVNIFTKQGQFEYAGFNPSKTMPTVIDGFTTVVADLATLIKFLCRKKGLDEKFYPVKDMNKDKRKMIDAYLEYVSWVVKRNTDRIMKLKIQKVSLERGLSSKHKGYKEEEEQVERDIFYNKIIPYLEKQLDGGKYYLCGYDFSVADIAMFNQLINTIELLQVNFDSKKFPNVDKWMSRIEDVGPIRKYNIIMQKEVIVIMETLK